MLGDYEAAITAGTTDATVVCRGRESPAPTTATAANRTGSACAGIGC